jgi:acyl-CoA synthetase (AMP-forming)/AMP-acid ligase II
VAHISLPKIILIVASIPVMATGKTNYKEVTELAAGKVISTEWAEDTHVDP